MRSRVRVIPFCLGVLILGGGLAQSVHADDLARRLDVLSAGYPRAYFFRAAEGMAANPRISYAQWEKTFVRLMGIEGKALDEEIPGRSKRNVSFFTRLKQQHPRQLVLLHYNGNARDPRDAAEAYFAGHWIYHNGAKILSDVPAEPGETDVRVGDPQLFHVNIGRYRTANDDVGLCILDDRGRPDWSRSEQVQLIAVDVKKGTLRVRRGCFGTRPRTFPAGRSYAAAHVTEGPWGKRSHLMWFYNYSTCCPRDARGRTCTDVLVDELAARFLPGGELAAFDGVEFDVLHHQHFGAAPRRGGRSGDYDADGKADYGLIDGANTYGIGVIEFCRRLRDRLGDTKLLLADGAGVRSQRAFGILNGIESEGWPTLSDWAIKDWSGGMNRHEFWRQNARPPVFNYINHKFTMAGPTPGSRRKPEVPYKIHRLVLAAAQFTDAAVCYSFAPPPEDAERLGIWDELRKGIEHQVGWLGKPLSPARRLALDSPDLLQGRGRRWNPDLVGRFQGAGVTVAAEDKWLRVTSARPDAGRLSFRLRDVPCDGPDLFVSVTMRGAPLPAHPSEMARLTWVGIPPAEGTLVTSSLPELGMKIRGRPEAEADPDTGAMIRFFPKRTLGGEAHDAYLVHPPYRGGTGQTFWQRDVRVPTGGRLEFFLGMGEKAPARSDGVTFQVLAGELHGDRPGPLTRIFQATQVESRWTSHAVSLARWAGKTVRLRFVSDCGSNDNATTDHSHWGDVFVVGPDGRRDRTDPVRFMTWTGTRAFASGFYFSHVRSRKVDLEFEVEGTAPVWLADLSVHARPDAIIREFARGLVLANPAAHAEVFDLNALVPGGTFRRLQGSSRQDPKANDGSAVSGKLTLEEREGLFLVRTQTGPKPGKR